MLLYMLRLGKMNWKRMTGGEQSNSLGEQEGFSVPGSRTETIHMINNLQVNFLIKWKQIPKQRYFFIFPLITYLGVAQFRPVLYQTIHHY